MTDRTRLQSHLLTPDARQTRVLFSRWCHFPLNSLKARSRSFLQEATGLYKFLHCGQGKRQVMAGINLPRARVQRDLSPRPDTCLSIFHTHRKGLWMSTFNASCNTAVNSCVFSMLTSTNVFNNYFNSVLASSRFIRDVLIIFRKTTDNQSINLLERIKNKRAS